VKLLTQPKTVSASREALIDLSGDDTASPCRPTCERTATPILLDNDANVIVLSERRGQRDRFDDMLLTKASTGLGCGHRSPAARSNAERSAPQANSGTPRLRPPPVACRCGDTGCLEAIAGE
jgi:predicted NBD/HSP70 family sugar kinase